MALLADHDIFSLIACEWIELQDLVHLDSAITNKEMRALWFAVLEAVPVKIPFQDEIGKWWKYNQRYFEWIIKRSVFESDGELNVHQTLWNSLLNNGQYNYLPFIERLRRIRFLGFDRTQPFGFQGLERCLKVQHMRICNLYKSTTIAEGLQLCPQLESLEFHNTTINNAVLLAFSRCPKLKKVLLYHVNYDVDNLSPEIVESFLHSLDEVEVVAKIPDFILHFGAVKNHLLKLKLDGVQHDITPEFGVLLEHSAALRSLWISRLTIDHASLFQLANKHCPSIESLHVDHCRLAVTASTSAVLGAGGDFSKAGISSLRFSSLLHNSPSLSLEDLVLWDRSKLERLHLSFCDFADPVQFVPVLKQCSGLVSIEIEDKKLNWESDEGREKLTKFISLFAQVPEVRLVAWPGWMRESDKDKDSHSKGREVLYEKSH